MPGEELMRQLLDKLSFQTLARELGFAIPKAVRLSQPDITSLLEDLRFPCVIKPAIKTAGYEKRFRKAYRVATREEALQIWQQIGECTSVAIMQEWIEGGDSEVYFCLQYRPPSGQGVTSFVGRKLRQWPPLVGGTGSCVPAPEAAELVSTTNRFFSAVGFVGLCSMEFKRDSRDGTFYLVEPTVGRTDFQEEVATLNGVNIPFAAYRGELGLDPPKSRPVRACGWRDPIGDANSLAATGSTNSAPVTLRDAYWRMNDPGPYLALQSQRIRQRVSRLRLGAR
jgi:predicted ATP-grasp superfamily ATP-dependent carboligase